MTRGSYDLDLAPRPRIDLDPARGRHVSCLSIGVRQAKPVSLPGQSDATYSSSAETTCNPRTICAEDMTSASLSLGEQRERWNEARTTSSASTIKTPPLALNTETATRQSERKGAGTVFRRRRLGAYLAVNYPISPYPPLKKKNHTFGRSCLED